MSQKVLSFLNGSFAMASFQLFYLFVFTLVRETPYDAEREKRPFALTHLLPSSFLVMRKKRPAAARRYVYTGGAKKYLGKQKFANFGTYLLRNKKRVEYGFFPHGSMG